jgi:hypothetical protein
MAFLTRMTIRLFVLVIAGYGAKAVYEDFVAPLRAPSRDFVDHARASLATTEARVSDATTDLAQDVQRAARHAGDEVTRNVSDQQRGSVTATS